MDVDLADYNVVLRRGGAGSGTAGSAVTHPTTVAAAIQEIDEVMGDLLGDREVHEQTSTVTAMEYQEVTGDEE